MVMSDEGSKMIAYYSEKYNKALRSINFSLKLMWCATVFNLLSAALNLSQFMGWP